MLQVYTIAYGDIFRDVFNAVVTILGSSTMATALRISIVIAGVAVAAGYTKSRSVGDFGKWFLLYFGVTVGMLGIKQNVQIVDLTNPAGIYEVDNVPLGLAAPISLISKIGHALAEEFDIAMQTPDSVTYTKTGVLFGATLFRNASTFQLQDKETQKLMTEFIPRCVVGDMLLNHKYTMDDLLKNQDPWGMISGHASPARGMFVNMGGQRQFQSCQQVATTINQQLNQTVLPGGTTFNHYVNKLFGNTNRPDKNALFSQLLQGSNQFFTQNGQGASQIIKNNVVNNAIRAGIRLNASETDATAAMESLAETTAFEKMRLSWAVDRDIASGYIPMFFVFCMLLQIALFPLIVLLAVQGALGSKVLKSYIYSHVYLQSWPILYAIMNYIATSSFKQHVGVAGLTLSNSNELMNQYSDLAGIAGKMEMAIPFLAVTIIGFAEGLSRMATYMGGGIQSAIASESSQAATGNWSLNNMSMDNFSANKWDANGVTRSGMYTMQTADGSTVSYTPDGSVVANANVSTQVSSANISGMYQRSLQHSLQDSRQATETAMNNFNNSVSATASDLVQAGSQVSHNEGITSGTEFARASNINQAVDNMQTLATDYSHRHGVSMREAYTDLVRHSFNGSGSIGGFFGFGGSNGEGKSSGNRGLGFSIGGSGGLNYENGSTTDQSASTENGFTDAHDARVSRAFKDNMDYLQSHRSSIGAQMGDNVNSSVLDQAMGSYQSAGNYNEQVSASLVQSNQYSDMLSKSRSDSLGYNTNLSNDFVKFVTENAENPSMIAPVIGGSSSPAVEAVREDMMQRFVNSRMSPDMTSPVSSSGVSSSYEKAHASVQEKGGGLHDNFEADSSRIRHSGQTSAADEIRDDVSGYMAMDREKINMTHDRVGQGKTEISADGDRTKGGVVKNQSDIDLRRDSKDLNQKHNLDFYKARKLLGMD